MHSSAPQPNPKGNDALSAGLGTFPVLDAASAIALMDESDDLYLEIAQAYWHELSGLVTSLDAALQQTNLSEAGRTLHTFKGLSLTVGAQRLSEVCRRCELVLKTLHSEAGTLKPEDRIAMTTTLGESAQQTGHALAALMEQRHATPLAPVAQPVALAVELRDLRQLLARSDLAALDSLVALQARHTEMSAQLQRLADSLKAFDFKEAMVQCDELIRNFSPLS